MAFSLICVGEELAPDHCETRVFWSRSGLRDLNYQPHRSSIFHSRTSTNQCLSVVLIHILKKTPQPSFQIQKFNKNSFDTRTKPCKYRGSSRSAPCSFASAKHLQSIQEKLKK